MIKHRRRAHTKSRTGCSACRTRHMKCDEQGPPCHNCIERGTACSGRRAVTLYQKPPCLGLPEQLCSTLHLQLMHHWTTQTYTILCSVPHDWGYMKLAVPRGGFEYEYILDGLLACAALELDSRCQDVRYRRAASYHNARGIASFRQQLSHVKATDTEWIYIFSKMVIMIDAGFQVLDSRSAIDGIVSLFELLIGAGALAQQHWSMLLKSNYGPSIAYMVDLQGGDCDEGSALALMHLETLLMGRHAHALAMLRMCLAKSQNMVRSFVFAFPVMAGRPFVEAVRSRDEAALLILLHFLVLIRSAAERLWFAGSLTRNVAVEVFAVLRKASFAGRVAYWRIVSWVRQRLDLSSEEGEKRLLNECGI